MTHVALLNRGLTWRPLALMARRGAPAPLGARLCDRLCFGTVALPRRGDLLDGLVVGPVADPGAADAKRLESVSMKRKLSFIYIFSMVCLGLCYGAQCVHTLGWGGMGWGGAWAGAEDRAALRTGARRRSRWRSSAT